MYPKQNIYAFTDSGLTFPKEMHVKQVLSFGWPCEYRLDDSFIARLIANPDLEHRLNIDFSGRNHGVDEAVYINTDGAVGYLKELGIIPL